MPRVSGIYSRPTGIDAVANNTIDSGKYNSNVADVEADLNLPRPIIAGGTGATSAAGARDNIDAEVAGTQVLNYDTHLFEAGSFYSLSGVTGSPEVGFVFTGICYKFDNSNITIEARKISGITPDKLYIRQMSGGVWGTWVLSSAADASDKVAKAGDTMTGSLTLTLANPSLILNKAASGQTNSVVGKTAGINRWQMQIGDASAESAGTGSNFSLQNFNDAGTLLSTPFTISRLNGLVAMSQGAVLNGATKTSSPFGGKNQAHLDAAIGGGFDVIGTTTGVAGALIGFANSNGATTLGYIAIAGASPGTGVNYVTSSDGRLKEDLQPFTRSGEIIDALRVFDFRWKSTQQRDVGVIAQEAKEHLPGAVSQAKTPEGDIIWGVDYGKFTIPLLEEVKRLRKRVADLEAVVGATPMATILQRLDVLDKFREKIEAL